MKKRNLFLGMLLAIGLTVAGCGANSDPDVTRVEQNRTLAEASEGMQADAPKTEEENNVLVTDGADDEEVAVDKAKEIAFSDAGIKESDVKGVRVEKDFDDGRHQYDIDFYAGNKEYDYEIDAYSGDILNKDYDIENDFSYESSVQASDYISKEEAVKIVLDRVKGATENQVLIELDEDDGRLIYEGEVHYNNREFEFEMNASNGKILEWSEESAVD